jgi:hypothetical protein
MVKAGIGAITAFTISVCLTFVLVVYGFYFVPDSYPEWMINEIDRTWLRTVNALIGRFRSPSKAQMSKKMFCDVVLIFSDQQLVLGLAMLVVGFTKTATISQYHFAVVSDLAGMAFVVHVASIDIIAEDLRNRPEKKWWRAIGILLIAILVLVSRLPALNSYYLYTYGSPVQCIWSNMPGNSTPTLMAQNIIYSALSLWGICTILNMLFPSLLQKRSFTWVNWLVLKLTLSPRRAYYASLRHLPGSSGLRKWLWTIAGRVLYGLAFFMFVGTEVLFCEAVDKTRDWALLLYYAIHLFTIRANSSMEGKLEDENQWGFGQAVPVFLLTLPLLTLFEVYYGECLAMLHIRTRLSCS